MIVIIPRRTRILSFIPFDVLFALEHHQATAFGSARSKGTPALGHSKGSITRSVTGAGCAGVRVHAVIMSIASNRSLIPVVAGWRLSPKSCSQSDTDASANCHPCSEIASSDAQRGAHSPADHHPNTHGQPFHIVHRFMQYSTSCPQSVLGYPQIDHCIMPKLTWRFGAWRNSGQVQRNVGQPYVSPTRTTLPLTSPCSIN